MKDFLKKLVTSRMIIIIASVLMTFALTGFSDIGKALSCVPQPEQCLADAAKRLSQAPSAEVAAAVAEKAPEVELMTVKTIEGDIVQTVPPAEAQASPAK